MNVFHKCVIFNCCQLFFCVVNTLKSQEASIRRGGMKAGCGGEDWLSTLIPRLSRICKHTFNPQPSYLIALSVYGMEKVQNTMYMMLYTFNKILLTKIKTQCFITIRF